MNALRCVVIDDEPLGRSGIADHIEKIGFLQPEVSGSNIADLERVLKSTPIDLILLDVQMPGTSGIEFLRNQPERPMVILTTAYPQYALESYQLDVMDYLVKPVTFERFLRAATKAWDYHRMKNAAQSPEYFFIKEGYRQEKIFFRDILFIEGVQNYVSIYTTERKYLTLLSLKQLQETLPAGCFIRVHKSFIVAVDKVSSVMPAKLLVGKTTIPVGRLYSKVIAGKIIKNGS